MFGASAGAAFAVAPPAAAGDGEGGGGGGGPYAGRGPSLGPRQMRIRCRDSRRSTSLRSCSFISSTSLRMRPTSNTLSALGLSGMCLGSLIGIFRSLGGGLGGGVLPAGRRGRRESAIATEIRGRKSEVGGN